jgi:hypothetical protein
MPTAWGLVLLVLPFLVPESAQALLRRVPEDLPTIQAAIDSSLATGDTVVVARGVWTEQLFIGPGRLTLASEHIFTGDTLDIEETVLDGEQQRNILFVAMDDSSQLELMGLTIRGGLKSMDWDTGWTTGGGVHFESPVARVRLRHLVFREGRGGTGSALWYAGAWFPFNNAHFDLENINVFDNHIPGNPYGTNQAFVIDDCRTLQARRLFVKGSTAPGSRQWSLSARDSTDVAGMWITGVTSALNNIAYLGVGRFGHARIRDIYFTNNHAYHPGSLVISCGEGAHLHLRNIHVSDNYYQDSPVDEASIGPNLTILADNASVDAESLFVNRNRVENCGTLLTAQAIFPAAPSWIRHLEVSGNRVGSRTAQATGGYNQRNPVKLTDLNLHGAIFADDTLESRYLGIGEYSSMSSWVLVSTIGMDTLRVSDVRLENLQHIDNDEYLEEDAMYGGAHGLITATRSLLISTYLHPDHLLRYVFVDSVIVRNSRINLILPEIDIPDMFQSTYIGTTMAIGLDHNQLPPPTVVLNNITLDGCDDGGLALSKLGSDVEISNLAILNTQRRGLYMTFGLVQADCHLRIRNLLLQNIQQEEFHRAWPYPLELVEQSALKLLVGSGIPTEVDIRNISILDCDLPILIQLKQRSDGSAYSITNALIAGNSYDFLQPWWSWTPPIDFRYSAVQEAVSGQHNLLIDDPGFDPDLGPPWLSFQSPCVDAGDPAPEDRDLEDPARPGVALWPSLGALRNDIGYTGGPGARASEYLVRVEPAPGSPATRPAGLALQPAYPNPFNATTTLRYTLTRPGRVRLAAYDLLGREVRVIEHRARGAGEHAASFDATGLASGVYLVELVAGRERAVRKVLLVK